MSEPVEEDCPVWNSSQSTKDQFATANVAEHIMEKAPYDDSHQQWLEEHTASGTLAEIRTALEEKDRLRQ